MQHLPDDVVALILDAALKTIADAGRAERVCRTWRNLLRRGVASFWNARFACSLRPIADKVCESGDVCIYSGGRMPPPALIICARRSSEHICSVRKRALHKLADLFDVYFPHTLPRCGAAAAGAARSCSAVYPVLAHPLLNSQALQWGGYVHPRSGLPVAICNWHTLVVLTAREVRNIVAARRGRLHQI